MMAKPRTAFARTDVVTPVSGLFRATAPGAGRLEATEIVFTHDEVEHTYVTPYRLGAEEWRLLVACAALAGLDGDRFNGSDASGTQLTLWDNFLTEGIAARKDGIRFRASTYALLREVGLADSGQNRRVLTKQLGRLSAVTERMSKGGRTMSGARLLSFAHDEESGELSVGLSPHMARAILGESRQYTRVSLVEVRALDHPAAILLHAYFSARIRAGRSAKYPLDHLVSVVYGDGDVSPATLRKRAETVRNALLSFNGLTTWSVGLDRRRQGRGYKWLVTVERITQAQLEQWERERVQDEFMDLLLNASDD